MIAVRQRVLAVTLVLALVGIAVATWRVAQQRRAAVLNPDFEDGNRRQIYRMRRVPLEQYAAWAGSAGEAKP